MSIKTSELQQLQSILGTDSLLADTAAAGTGRLSLARAAEFFGAELVKPANPVGAALSNKAAKSTQETVEATSVPSRTVAVAAADLPAYIAGLPKLLTEHLIVKVSGTLTAASLSIANFYGPGSLTVKAEEDGDAVFQASVRVSTCAVPVTFLTIRFQDPAPGTNAKRFGLSAVLGSTVCASACSFSSTSGGTDQNNGYVALNADNGALVIAYGIKNASGCSCVALAAACGVIRCSAATAGALHDNVYGAYVWEGGIVYVGGASPDTLGGTANAKDCGLIVKGGTLL